MNGTWDDSMLEDNEYPDTPTLQGTDTVTKENWTKGSNFDDFLEEELAKAWLKELNKNTELVSHDEMLDKFGQDKDNG